MRKRLDDLFSALMLLAAVAVVLAGWFVLTNSIARAGEAVPPRVGQAQAGTEAAARRVSETEAPALTVSRRDSAAPEPEEAPPPYIYDPAIPLDAELQAALRDACAEYGVPVSLALGLVEVESCFQTDAVSDQGCYGLCQLNPRYFPEDLPPADNLRAGIGYLGRLLGEYPDAAAALTAYNVGYDTGRRGFANAVLDAAEWW